MTRPTRQKKHDRLLSPLATQAEISCDMATAPFDRVCIEMDRKWGVDRLPELVSVETAAKWGSALGKMNAAIVAADLEETKARVEVCIRGFRAMDAEAAAAGHQPADPDIWEIELDGQRIGIIREGREWPAAHAKRPGLTVYSLREAAIALLAYKSAGPVVEAVKAAFPGSEITAIRNMSLEDTLPF